MSRNITIDDLYLFKQISRPRISPDGQQVAYVVTTIDKSTQKYCSSIWISSIDSEDTRRFTGGASNAHSPCWSPDGRWLAFVTDREGEPAGKEQAESKKHSKAKSQIWLIPTDGGEARQLTFMQHGASNPVWAPDNQRIIFNAQVGAVDDETEDGKLLPKARVIDRLWYRLDGVGFIYERRNHLFLIDLSGAESHQLTDGDWDDSDPAWSSDGSRIAFASSRAEDHWRLPCPDIYTLAITDGKSGELKCLTNGSLACSNPSWSPDGSKIIFVYDYSNYATKSTIEIINSDGSDQHTIFSGLWASDGSPRWSPDGSRIIFYGDVKNQGYDLCIIPNNYKVGENYAIAGTFGGVLGNPGFSVDGRYIIFSAPSTANVKSSIQVINAYNFSPVKDFGNFAKGTDYGDPVFIETPTFLVTAPGINHDSSGNAVISGPDPRQSENAGTNNLYQVIIPAQNSMVAQNPTEYSYDMGDWGG